MLPDPVLFLLRRQHAAVADHQLRDVLPKLQRRSVHRDPAMARVGPRVLVHRGFPPTPGQHLIVPVLDAGPGAALWGKTAATWWGFGRFRTSPVHVGRPRCRTRGDWLGQVHLIRDLDPRSLTTHQDVPILRPEPTVLWLAGAFTHAYSRLPELAVRKTEQTLDHAWRLGLIDGRAIHALAETGGGRGRSGIVALRTALERRPPDYRPHGSALEERFESILPDNLTRDLDRQTPIHDEELIGVTDFRYRPWPLVIEINGELWHTSLTDRAADDRRYARLRDVGFSVVVYWEHDVWHDADVVHRSLLEIVARPDAVPTLHRPTRAPWLF